MVDMAPIVAMVTWRRVISAVVLPCCYRHNSYSHVVDYLIRLWARLAQHIRLRQTSFIHSLSLSLSDSPSRSFYLPLSLSFPYLSLARSSRPFPPITRPSLSLHSTTVATPSCTTAASAFSSPSAASSALLRFFVSPSLSGSNSANPQQNMFVIGQHGPATEEQKERIVETNL